MDKDPADARLREAFARMAPLVDGSSLLRDVRARVCGPGVDTWEVGTGAEDKPVDRKHRATARRSGLRPAAYASVAVILIALVAVAVWEARAHLREGNAGIVMITDDTTGLAPHSSASTGQSAQSAGTTATTTATTQFINAASSDRMGTRLWRFQVGGELFSSPAVSEGVVYFSGSNGYLHARDARTGAAKWRFAAGPPYYSSPAVWAGIVYVASTDGQVYAVDAETGAEKWKFAAGGTEPSRPAVVDGLLYVATNRGYLYAIDAVTGHESWRFPTGGEQVSSPAVSNGVVYISTYGGYLNALDAKNGSTLWRVQTGGAAGSPTVSGGVVYVGTGDYLYAVQAQTGAVKWRFDSVDRISRSAPTVSDGSVYFTSTKPGLDYDYFYLEAVDVYSGWEKWKFQSRSPAGGMGLPLGPASPTVSDGVVYAVTDGGYLHAVNARSGQEEWRFKTDGEIFGSPAIAEGVLFFASLDGFLYAVTAPLPSTASGSSRTNAWGDSAEIGSVYTKVYKPMDHAAASTSDGTKTVVASITVSSKPGGTFLAYDQHGSVYAATGVPWEHATASAGPYTGLLTFQIPTDATITRIVWDWPVFDWVTVQIWE